MLKINIFLSTLVKNHKYLQNEAVCLKSKVILERMRQFTLLRNHINMLYVINYLHTRMNIAKEFVKKTLPFQEDLSNLIFKCFCYSKHCTDICSALFQ
ncbi:hypothetical protein X975_03752, partial [Stegodyphus mimosarum]